MTKAFAVLLHIIIYLGIYACASAFLKKPAFPSLSVIWQSHLVPSIREIGSDLPYTIMRWLFVFLIGVITAVIIGLLIGYHRRLHATLKADIDFGRSFPATALITFFMAAFGDTEITRSLPALYITFFTVLFYASKHSSLLKNPRVRHLRDLGANSFFILRHCIILELSNPLIIAARQALSLSFLVMISTEFIIGSSHDKGLGKLFYDWLFQTNYGRFLVGLTILGITGYSFNSIGAWIHKRLIRWETVED